VDYKFERALRLVGDTRRQRQDGLAGHGHKSRQPFESVRWSEAMNLFFWRRPKDAWFSALGSKYGRYVRPSTSYGMTTDNELQLLETYAREEFTGAGRIVDLGCWYGATTLSLVRGLASNRRATTHRTIEAFDLFEWYEWMDPIAAQLSLPRRYSSGESFYEDVRELLRPHGSLVRAEKQDLLLYMPPPIPIEFLFVDAMKNWDLAQKIVSRFFPLLIRGTSYVVLQDFAYYYPEIATNHLIMWYLRDYFRCVHHVPRSCSVVFRCVEQPRVSALPVFAPSLFTPGMIEEAYEYSMTCVSPEARIMVDVARLNFLVEQGHSEASMEQVKRLARCSGELSEPMLAEVRRVVARCAAEQRACDNWLTEIDDWAASLSKALAN
jgi:hypothetical protein